MLDFLFFLIYNVIVNEREREMRKLDIWQSARENENNTKYYDKNGNVQVIVNKGVNAKNLPTVKMWFGKAQKPRYNYYFRDEEKCIKFINENATNYITQINKKIDNKELVKEIRKNYTPKIKVGDILHKSFGYSMILNEFYQVIAINKKKITVREIDMEMTSTGYLSWSVKPIPYCFIGKEQTKILQIDFSNIDKPHEYIKIDGYWCDNVTQEVEYGRTWTEDRND